MSSTIILDEKELYVILGIIGIKNLYGLSTDSMSNLTDDDIRLAIFSLARKGFLETADSGKEILLLSKRARILTGLKNTKKTIVLNNRICNSYSCIYISDIVISAKLKGVGNIKYYITSYPSIEEWIECTDDLIDQVLSDATTYDNTDIITDLEEDIDSLIKNSFLNMGILVTGEFLNLKIYIVPGDLTDLIITETNGNFACFHYSNKLLLELVDN